jgi:hypothetical protein
LRRFYPAVVATDGAEPMSAKSKYAAAPRRLRDTLADVIARSARAQLLSTYSTTVPRFHY